MNEEIQNDQKIKIRFLDDEGKEHYEMDREDIEVTHWMPSPNPPEENEDYIYDRGGWDHILC